MKYLLKIITITFSCFFLVCPNNIAKKENTPIIQETLKTVIDTSIPNNFRERLKAIQAVTKVQFKNGLPKQLENFIRTKFT